MDRSGSRSLPEPERQRDCRVAIDAEGPPIGQDRGPFLVCCRPALVATAFVAETCVSASRDRAPERAGSNARERGAQVATRRWRACATAEDLGADPAAGHLAFDLALGLDVCVDLLAELVRLRRVQMDLL